MNPTSFSRRTFVLGSVALAMPALVRPASAGTGETVVEPGSGDLGRTITGAAKNGAGTLRLRPGDHGPLGLQGVSGAGMKIVADMGAVVGQTTLQTCSGLRFEGVAFRGEKTVKTTMPAHVQVNPQSADIHFTRCSFAVTDDIGAWRDLDWVERPYQIGVLVRGRDVRIEECRFFHLRNCLGLGGEGHVIEKCTFENFGNDGIQFGASRLKILNNTIRGTHHTPADPLHADGMQGYPAPNNGIHSDILIDGNTVEFVGPGDYMQGISIFDGRWRNVTVSNNTVRINTWNAIAIYGVDGVVVENNTVTSTDPKIRNWIEVRASKSGAASTGIVVRDNVAPLFKTGPGAQVSNNRVRLR